MIHFNRYQHINDLLEFYIEELGDSEIKTIFQEGVKTEHEAEVLSRFIWKVVDQIHVDEEAGRIVLNRVDNTDMLPDLGYEVTKYMRAVGFYDIWERISDNI